MSSCNTRDSSKRRYWEIILYPEWDNFTDIVEHIKRNFSLWVLSPVHDKDVNLDGTLKKAHYHMMISLPNPRVLNESLLADFGGVPANCVQYIIEWGAAVRYTTHYNRPDKAQYSVADIQSSVNVESYFMDEDENSQAFGLVDLAMRCSTVRELVQHSIALGYYGQLRRSASLFLAIVKENNKMGFNDEQNVQNQSS